MTHKLKLSASETKNVIADAIADALSSIHDDLCDDFAARMTRWLKVDLATELCSWVNETANKAVTALIDGDESRLRYYLSCEVHAEGGFHLYTGRPTEDYQWERNQILSDGVLYEHDAVALRRRIVDAHRDVLITERILDLESQAEALTAAVSRAIAERDAAHERIRALLLEHTPGE